MVLSDRFASGARILIFNFFATAFKTNVRKYENTKEVCNSNQYPLPVGEPRNYGVIVPRIDTAIKYLVSDIGLAYQIMTREELNLLGDVRPRVVICINSKELLKELTPKYYCLFARSQIMHLYDTDTVSVWQSSIDNESSEGNAHNVGCI